MQPIYTPGASRLHGFHPLTKLTAAGVIIAAAYTLPWSLAPLVLFLGVILLAAQSGVAALLLRTVVGLLLPVTLSLFLIQGILFPPPNATPLPLGPITLTREGLLQVDRLLPTFFDPAYRGARYT